MRMINLIQYIQLEEELNDLNKMKNNCINVKLYTKVIIMAKN